ncbi:hypothetical protein QTP86_020340 [Hemibagrus guttatus]|nr:hypothetical protein QTP86_020340 [Hemibagrus guttatus]
MKTLSVTRGRKHADTICPVSSLKLERESMYMMISTPQHHRIRISDPAMPAGCFVPSPGPSPISPMSPPSPCMPRTSPSPRMRKLMLTLPLAGHMVRGTCDRRHSWHPGVVQCSHTQCGQRSVSLETLDPGEMEKVQSPLQSFSMSVPSLCSMPNERHPSLTMHRPRSHAQAHSSLSSLLGGSTQSSLQVDAELSSELWDSKETTEGQGVQNEESEKPNGLRSLVRSLSFLGKMARNYKVFFFSC